MKERKPGEWHEQEAPERGDGWEALIALAIVLWLAFAIPAP